jgi:hypothetical protein
LTFPDFEDFTMTTAVMNREEVEIRTVYVFAGAQHVTVARASGTTAVKAMTNLLGIPSA